MKFSYKGDKLDKDVLIKLSLSIFFKEGLGIIDL